MRIVTISTVMLRFIYTQTTFFNFCLNYTAKIKKEPPEGGHKSINKLAYFLVEHSTKI